MLATISCPRRYPSDLHPRFLEERHAARRRLFGYSLLAVFLTALLTILTLPGTSWCQKSSGKFELKTTAFQPGGDIPKQFTCDGADISPALSWTTPPAGTQSFALIMDDPDAPRGTFVHWVLFNLPASERHLPERVPGNEELRSGARQGINGFPKTGYGGPCPPGGKPHRYFFKLYALDTKLNLNAGTDKQGVEEAMKGHVLAQAELMGRYAR